MSESSQQQINTGGYEQRSRDQTVLPFGVAFQLCMSGIRTRLGRSAITLLGVALGIAFLMSVLTGFHFRTVLAYEMELSREMLRRSALLRGEVGQLRGKRFAIFGEATSRKDARFIELLKSSEAELIYHPDDIEIRLEELSSAELILLLGGARASLPAGVSAENISDLRIVYFELPPEKVLAHLEKAEIPHRALHIESGHEDDAARAAQTRMRLYWIVTLSLLITVGGVTNALLMSVTERFREIATMKCLGALSAFVIKLFLIESAIIGMAGSFLGMLIGLLLPAAIYGYGYGFRVLAAGSDLKWLGAAGAICILVGTALAMVSGIYPARVAAKMIPADALRSNV